MDFDYFKTQLKLLQPPKNQEADYLATYDQIVRFVFDKVMNDVRLYTHIPYEEDLPESINQTIVMMASSLIGSFGLINDDEANSNDEIKKITEGDTSVEFADKGARLQQAFATSSISGNFRGMLNRIRRLPQ